MTKSLPSLPYLLVGFLVIAGIFLASFQYLRTQAISRITTFEDCSFAGFPVMESYPPRCTTPDGRTFTQVINESPLPTSETSPDSDEMVACTMDAKICPDGSAVGRTPPTCEFAACPGE